MDALMSKIRSVKRALRVQRTRRHNAISPTSILSLDILDLICAYLPRRELARLMRVSRLCFDISSVHLYACCAGIEYGQETHLKGFAEPFLKIPRNIFGGVHKPLPRRQPPAMGSIIPRVSLSRRPRSLVISNMKIELLRLVKHFSYYPHEPEESDLLALPAPSFNILPSLEMLSINLGYRYQLIPWESTLLSSLRPSHIRLVNVNRVDYEAERVDLSGPIGSKATKVTVHVAHCCFGPKWETLPLKITWPESLREVDLVFTRQAHTARMADLSCTLAGDRLLPPIMGPMDDAARAVARVAASVEGSNTRVRVFGAGKRTRTPNQADKGATADGAEMRFLERLRNDYKSALERTGIDGELLRVRVENLQILTLEEYWDEGNVRF